MRNRWLPWFLLAPALLLIIGLTIYPLLYTFFLSFQRYDMYSIISGEAEWAGFENYRETLTDPFFWKVTRNTVVFGLTCVVGTMIVDLCVARLFHTKSIRYCTHFSDLFIIMICIQ